MLRLKHQTTSIDAYSILPVAVRLLIHVEQTDHADTSETAFALFLMSSFFAL